MIKIMPYTAELKATWDNFVESSKNGIFMFKRDFMDYHADSFIAMMNYSRFCHSHATTMC